jgi:hypothetical protein
MQQRLQEEIAAIRVEATAGGEWSPWASTATQKLHRGQDRS